MYEVRKLHGFDENYKYVAIYWTSQLQDNAFAWYHLILILVRTQHISAAHGAQ